MFGYLKHLTIPICVASTIALFTLSAEEAIGQYNPEIFGKHRIQYRKFEWKYYEGNSFKIYHYDRSGRELARYVVEQVERDISAIEKRLSGLFPEKINIVLYNNFDEYDQSNVGLARPSSFKNNNAAGNLDIVNDKIVVYFNGDHGNLKEQLRLGMAQIVMERMLFGENFREILKNMVTLDLPKWATEGYVSYVVTGWTAEDDNEWKNLVMRDNVTNKSFFELSEQYPRLVGKAAWKYLEEKYGENSIRNLLYMTQVKSGFNAAMKLTVGHDLKTFYTNTIDFYKAHYTKEATKYDSLVASSSLGTIPSPKPGERLAQVYVSPQGKDIAYVMHRNGEYEVVLEKTNLKDESRTQGKILKSGVLNYEDDGDPDYPMVAWSNNGFRLGIVYKENNNLFVKIYDANKSKVLKHRIPKNKIDRITGFTFMEDDEFIVFSGIKNGQSDIFEYYLKRNRITPVTQDAWDDANPVFVSGGSRKGIVFLSNRPEPKINIQALPNELPTGNLKAYFYNSTTKSYDLLPLSQNFDGRIKHVIPYGMDNFAFLSDASGISNRYVVMFARDEKNADSAYVVPVTNYNNGILFQQYHPNGQNIVEVVKEKDKIQVFFSKANLPAPWGDLQPKNPTKNTFVENRLDPSYIAKQDAAADRNAKISDIFDEKTTLKITAGEDFQTSFDINEKIIITPQQVASEAENFAQKLNLKNAPSIAGPVKPTFYDPVSRAYISDSSVIFVDSTFITLRSSIARSNVKLNYTGLSIDNSVLFNRYQSYFHHNGVYRNPGLSFLWVTSLFDQYEDYRFLAGVRVPASLSGFSYFAQFENLKGRNDWGFSYYSFTNPMVYGFMVDANTAIDANGRANAHFLQFDFARPLNKTTALRGNLGYRQNNMILRAEDVYGLVLPNIRDHWGNLHLEYVYDNTKNPMFNIWNGMRAKVFGDFMYKFNDNNTFYEFNAYQQSKTGYVYNIGFDVRYYVPIYRSAIFAVRASGAHAAGTQQIMYFLGGMDNELSPRWSSGLNPTPTQNYAYQALATNLRGYQQNSRNGNTFALINAEVRIPVMSTILNKPTNSSILKNLQIVGFLDVGSAWEQLFTSTTRSNRRYSIYYWPARPAAPTVTLQLPGTSDEGLALGYGLGIRTKVLGYFLKLDGAMNLNNEFNYHISIGTDF